MKHLLLLTFSFLSLTLSFGQINNPGGTVSVCSGTFNDSGGAGSNYGDGEFIITTLCSSAGNCLSVNFTSFSLESGFDFLDVFDGSTTGSPFIGSFTGTTSPGTITSTSGCLTFVFSSDGGVNSSGWTSNISCGACATPLPDYLHGAVGINNELVSHCMVSDCGPSTITDDGGFAGNYSNGIGGAVGQGVYRTFCPSTAGNCMQITFNSLVLANNFDYLEVGNGATQNSPELTTTAPASNTAYGFPALHSDMTASMPLTYTSTDASGCLTLKFFTSGVNTAAGWDATLQCVPCAGGPSGMTNSDCQTLTALCSGVAVPGNSSGPGIVSDGCDPAGACPTGGENHSNWYTFQAFTTGTLEITITPTTATDDYDFAIYGPNASCSNLGSPLRCSDSGLQGNTGLTGTAGDNTEDVGGDSFVQTINATAGDQFILVVNEWSANAGSGYTLSFGGTASLDCIVLPVELSEFEAEYVPDLDVVDIYWATETERDNDYFVVERSINGIDFEELRIVDGVGNSTMETKYYTVDENPTTGINYYRLKQVDINGTVDYSEVRTVNLLDDAYDILSVVPNPTTDVTEVIFNCYSKEISTMKIYDAQGKLLETKELECTPGGNRVTVDLSQEKNGLYIISLNTNNKTYTERIIKN